ncbi:MAG: DegT/DnrJ/EryC1/StrS family aminotransferase [Chlamydiae bacterium]|nr:DegT/DnrJ/EryC1/StrS family aminotransferase [Chlamydiota bacterium]MBI3276217.1 DegT/DnrJ/EryC1/StrS family aminotransferase [Chlamydiota bacterium]
MIKVAKAKVGAEELQAVNQVFSAGWLGMGNFTLQFEEALAQYLGARNVIAVNTGTSALHLSLVALGIGPGDEVLVPSLTYVASFQAVSATGAQPVSCESNLETLLLDVDDAQRKITTRTKAIMPVHYCGQPCDMDRLLSWKDRYGIRIVEDAAHAMGSTFHKKKIGSFGDITCFSFDPMKIMTCGEGGAIATTDDDLESRLRNMRLLGVDRESEYRYRNERKWFYDVPMQGYRYHLSNINAAIGMVQLKKLDEFIARRREICLRYDAAFGDLPWLSLLKVDYGVTAPFMYIVRVPAESRDRFITFLQDQKIETGIHYLPNHWHTFYKVNDQQLPMADRLGREIVTLPLHSCLSDQEIQQVIKAVSSFQCVEVLS